MAFFTTIGIIVSALIVGVFLWLVGRQLAAIPRAYRQTVLVTRAMGPAAKARVPTWTWRWGIVKWFFKEWLGSSYTSLTVNGVVLTYDNKIERIPEE